MTTGDALISIKITVAGERSGRSDRNGTTWKVSLASFPLTPLSLRPHKVDFSAGMTYITTNNPLLLTEAVRQ